MQTPVEHQFQAEVSQVLHLVIHSLYSNREIFLRELVSNASDALDKRRFAAVERPELANERPLGIRISVDAEAGTLTVSDNGIGMGEAELAKNLGTIAWSGSREFLERLKGAPAGADLPRLIGQFGVGFYSAYLVADKVTVTSRAAGSSEAFTWESRGENGFTIAPASRDEPGTTVVLTLKPDHREYLEVSRLRQLIQRYSDYVSYPIELPKSGDPKKEVEFETVNRASALWQRSPKEVTEEQYTEFYKHLAHDWEAPLVHRHFQIEGTQMFSGLLFVPARPPLDLFDPEAHHGIRLHVRRVFVMDNCEDVLPRWLRFLRGVVDSEDLPLNVSRETLQDSRIVRGIKKQVVHQTLDLLADLKKEKPEDYLKFWNAFGPVLKEGLYFEPEQKQKLSELLCFESASKEKPISLGEYVDAMPAGQTAIYYVLAPTKRIAAASPHLERVRKHGYDVLLMTDGVDSFAMSSLAEFRGKPLVAVTSPDLKLPEEAAGEAPTQTEKEDAAGFFGRVRDLLAGKVADVRASARLTDSPVCLVQPEGALPPHVERLLRSQNKDVPASPRILELNLDHPLVKSVNALDTREPGSPRVKEWMDLLHDHALLAEGSPIEDPAAFAKRLTRLLTSAAEHELGST